VFLFTTSIVTTVGYGQLTPAHPIGQVLVIPYALVGVPLMLMFIHNVGDLFKSAIRVRLRAVRLERDCAVHLLSPPMRVLP
jgi:hypothetical protein